MTTEERFSSEIQKLFQTWLANHGFTGRELAAKRCRVHGYAMQGIYHYPANGDNYTYYECVHCLWDVFEKEVLA